MNEQEQKEFIELQCTHTCTYIDGVLQIYPKKETNKHFQEYMREGKVKG